VVISIFNEKLVKHVFDDYLGNGEVDLRSMSPTNYCGAFLRLSVSCPQLNIFCNHSDILCVPKTAPFLFFE